MGITGKSYIVSHDVEVYLDESKFDEAFIAEFQASFYDFDTIDEHREHLAQLFARGIVDEFTDFIEGYGPPKEMGIEFKSVEFWTESAR